MDNPTGFASLSQNEFSNEGPRLATNVLAETDYEEAISMESPFHMTYNSAIIRLRSSGSFC